MSIKIFVVDDEADFLELLNKRLTSSGYQTYKAQNGKELRELATSIRPDLIILDLVLGNEMGGEVYSAMLGNELDESIPIIFITAYSADHPSSPAMSGHRYALLKKPFQPEELLDQIKVMLEKV